MPKPFGIVARLAKFAVGLAKRWSLKLKNTSVSAGFAPGNLAALKAVIAAFNASSAAESVSASIVRIASSLKVRTYLSSSSQNSYTMNPSSSALNATPNASNASLLAPNKLRSTSASVVVAVSTTVIINASARFVTCLITSVLLFSKSDSTSTATAVISNLLITSSQFISSGLFTPSRTSATASCPSSEFRNAIIAALTSAADNSSVPIPFPSAPIATGTTTGIVTST